MPSPDFYKSAGYARSDQFRMRQLPKPEYHLLKALQKHYAIADTSNMMMIALRLMYEVHALQSPINGPTWIGQIIDTWMHNKGELREYDLTLFNQVVDPSL